MTKKKIMPLIAKLQSTPDAAWGPLLAGLDEAKRSYDPEAQVHTGNDRSYRTLASGGSAPFVDDGGKETLPDRAGSSRSYRALSSGGANLISDDGDGGKATPLGN
jgi:hypothetical protein